jgi:putative transposase
MIDKKNCRISISRQCSLLGLHRSGLYYKPVGERAENLEILRKMDEQYLRTPFFGKRRLRSWLRRQGYAINRKRVRRLMEIWGWQTIYRRPKTTIPKP